MKCGDCKHFEPAEESARFGYCSRVEHAGSGEDSNSREYRDEIAVVIDGSGYQAALLTKADFGCVLYVWMFDSQEAGT